MPDRLPVELGGAYRTAIGDDEEDHAAGRTMDEPLMRAGAPEDEDGGARTSCADNARAVALTGVVSMGALLFGFHLGYSSPAYDDVRIEAGLTKSEADLVFSVVSIGAMGGALVAGKVADFVGRRRAIMLGAVPFVAGPLMFAMWVTFAGLLIARVVTGFAVGYSSVLVPLYISEIAPAAMRGVLGTVNQLLIAGGILAVNVAGLPTLKHPHYWKALMLFSIGPAALEFLGMLAIGVETPAWLVSRGRREDAARSLRALRGPRAGVDAELAAIVAEREASGAGASSKLPLGEQMRRLGRRENMRPFVVGLIVVLLQQLSGINAFVFNTKALFVGENPHKDAEGRVSESKAHSALVGAILVSAVQVVFTGLSAGLVDRGGRRFYLCLSGAGLAAVSAAMGVAYGAGAAEGVKVALVMAYFALFALGLGPVTWIVISEVFPMETRGLLVSVVVVVSWLSAFLVTLSFNSLNSAIGDSGTFFLYAGTAFVGTATVYLFVPETRGRSLEQVADLFKAGWRWRGGGGGGGGKRVNSGGGGDYDA